MDLPKVGQVLCPVVVGRDEELATLGALLEQARAGRGSVAALVGEPGIGKSRLAWEVQQRAGVQVLRGRCVPGESPVPYLALAEALIPAFRMPVVDGDAAIAEVRPALRRVLMEQSARRSAEPSVSVVRDAVTRTMGALARLFGGVLLVLEDLHWADTDTLGVLDHVADHIGGEAVLCVLTLRDDPGPAFDFVEDLTARRAAHRILLRRLSREETEAMAMHGLGAPAIPVSLVDGVFERAEGVPFVVEEMLTAYVASGGDERAPATLPHTYRELVRTRLAAVDDATRDLLFAAAVLGRRFDWSLLSSITGSPREVVLEGLRAAVHAKLVTSDAAPGMEMPFGFRHALVRDAVLAELLPPELAELSARAADAIEDMYPGLPGAWCERIAELREAVGDRAAAARHLQEAAQRAFVRGALASAEAMLEHARMLVYEDRWHRIGIDRSLVEVLSAAGKIDRLREIAADAVAFVAEKHATIGLFLLGHGYLQLRLARGLAAAGDELGAETHLRHALAVAEATADERLLARIRVAEAARALARGDLAGARELARDATTLATCAGVKEVSTEALSVQGNAAFLAGDAEGAIHALEGARDAAGDDVVTRIPALVDLGRVQAAIRGDTASLGSARGLAANAGAVSAAVRADILIAATCVERFALSDAEGAATAAVDGAKRYGLALLTDATAVEAERRALMPGDADAARACDDLASATRAQVVLGLRMEDHAAAADAAARLKADPVARAAAVLLDTVAGRPIEPFPTAHALAAALLAAARSAGDAAKYQTADTSLGRFPWWRHVARRLIAGTFPGSGPMVRESIGFFEDAGHERLESACKALLRSMGEPVPRKGRGDSAVPAELRGRGVTSREMDVLRLIARGLGNVEISKQLFLSRRTVETHVASLMRKVGVTSRAGLSAAANSVKRPV